MGALGALAGVLLVEVLEGDPDRLRHHRPPSLRLHRHEGEARVDEHALLPGGGGVPLSRDAVAEDVVEILQVGEIRSQLYFSR